MWESTHFSVGWDHLLTHASWCIIHSHFHLCNTHKFLNKSLNNIPVTIILVQWLMFLVYLLELLVSNTLT